MSLVCTGCPVCYCGSPRPLEWYPGLLGFPNGAPSFWYEKDIVGEIFNEAPLVFFSGYPVVSPLTRP